MADEPENLTLKLLREMRAENRERHEKLEARLAKIEDGLASVKTDTSQIAAEVARLGVQAEDIKAEVLACRADVAGADRVRLTNLEKRVKALEEARPEV